MADKNLLEVDRNPGQERYHDLFDNRANIRDAENMAANGYEQDYSQAKDYSAGNSKNNNSYLKNRENSFANSQDNADFTDIRQRERQASKSDFETTGFDKDHSKDQARKQRMNGFRNKAIGGAFGLLACGGVSFGLFTVISGPMQLVQAAEVIQDFKLGVVTAQQVARSWRTTKSLATIANRGTISDVVENSRLGMLGKKQADAMIDRLADRGVEIKTNIAGYRTDGFRVDVSKQLGIDNPSDADIENLAKKMGIGDKFEINEVTDTLADGTKQTRKVLDVADNLNYSQATKALKALDDPGMSKIKSWTQTRATMKKLGYVKWTHPIEAADNKVKRKLADWIDDVVGKIMKPDDVDGRSKSEASKEEVDVDSDGDGEVDSKGHMTDEEIDASTKKIDDMTDSIDDFKADKPSRGIIRAGNFSADDLLNKALAGAGILAIISIICMFQSIMDSAGSYKQANIVNVAEKGSSLIMGLGSQVKSGIDINLDETSLAVEAIMGAEVDQLDIDGSATGQTVYSSHWSAAPVCAELGTAGCDGDESMVPDPLKEVAVPKLFGSSFLGQILDSILNGGGLVEAGIKFVCKVTDLVGQALDLLTSFVSTIITSLLQVILEQTGALNGLMNWIMGLLFGKPLDLTGMVPEQWGAVAMYGGQFTSNDQALGIGGKQLSSSEAIELNLENRRLLAWENSQKPLLARLVDPSDYNSSVNQIARAAQLNTSNQSFSTQLANVFKMFTSAPTIMATASNQLIGGSAYAASAYDYGVDTWAYNMDEMELALNGEEYDLITNAETVLTALAAEDEAGVNNKDYNKSPYHTYAYNCLGVEIESVDSGGKVKLADNQDGTVWNYIDNDASKMGYCQSAASDMLGLRLYVQDYFNVVSGACYEGDADDGDSTSACQEVGLDTGVSGSSTTAINTAGNQDPEVWQQSFVEETGNGTYGEYDTRSNGCTTISAWFVGAHTDLTYGHGNGKDVVDQLIAANPGAGLEATSTPTKAPSLFSAWEPSTMTSSAEYGHVGLVTAIDPDGTIHTLESGSGAGKKGSPWSFINTYTKEDYASNAKFVYLGDHLK